MTNDNTIEQEQVENHYPGVSDRVKAAFMDSFVMVAIMLMFTYIFSIFDNVPDLVRMIAFIFTFGLYDPLFTSLFGGTIGHMLLGIRVKRENNQRKNILFPLAIIRYVAKVLLGWISLLTVGSNGKSKAIHDLIAGSLVVYKK